MEIANTQLMTQKALALMAMKHIRALKITLEIISKKNPLGLKSNMLYTYNKLFVPDGKIECAIAIGIRK